MDEPRTDANADPRTRVGVRIRPAGDAGAPEAIRQAGAQTEYAVEARYAASQKT